jgi:N-acetylglucosaminyldiphosphoundecaprenol N-acetyl-beta-D-mannosaminyltransferase
MSRQTKFPKYKLLDVEVDALTQSEALQYIVGLTKKRGASYIVKPYVEFLDQAARRPGLTAILNQAELCLPDGIALLWSAHYLYAGPRNLARLAKTLLAILLRPESIKQPLPTRFGGVNFTWPLLEICQQHNLKIYLIGSPKHGDIQDTSHFLQQRLPNLRLVGQFSGQIDKSKFPRLLQQLDMLRPDVVLVGMGFPRQELLISQLSARLKHGVLIGEGGSFDYQELGGKYRRAPEWWQRIGLEWAWRLAQQPWRLKRQLAIPRFIARIYWYGRRLG